MSCHVSELFFRAELTKYVGSDQADRWFTLHRGKCLPSPLTKEKSLPRSRSFSQSLPSVRSKRPDIREFSKKYSSSPCLPCNSRPQKSTVNKTFNSDCSSDQPAKQPVVCTGADAELPLLPSMPLNDEFEDLNCEDLSACQLLNMEGSHQDKIGLLFTDAAHLLIDSKPI